MDAETKTLIAVISAGSAIAGAVVSQIVSIFRDVLDKRHARKVLLREKYEELANLITDSQDWLFQQMSASSLEVLRASHPADARRATVLAHIYFPKLHDVCENYVAACGKLQLFLIDNHNFHPEHDAGTQAAQSNPSELDRAGKLIQQRRQDVDDAIIKHASRYAKA